MKKPENGDDFAPEYDADAIDELFGSAMKRVAKKEKAGEKPKHDIGKDGKKGVLWPVE